MNAVTYVFEVTFLSQDKTQILIKVSEDATLGGEWQFADLWVVAARKANSYQQRPISIQFVEKIEA
jgi:hypothetical protein